MSAAAMPKDNIKGLHWCVVQLSRAESERLYGKMTFVMENGKVVRLIREESHLPPEQGLARAEKS